MVLPLVEGRERGWPWWTWVCLAGAPVLLGGFVVHQRMRAARGLTPLVDLAILGNRSFSVGSLIGFTFALVPPAFFFVLALYLQEGRGFSPLFSGVVFGSLGVGFFGAMLSAERMTLLLGRQILALGALVVAAGCALLALETTATSSLALVPGLAVVGVRDAVHVAAGRGSDRYRGSPPHHPREWSPMRRVVTDK